MLDLRSAAFGRGGEKKKKYVCVCIYIYILVLHLKKLDVMFEFMSSPTNTTFTLNQTNITSQSEVFTLINTRCA